MSKYNGDSSVYIPAAVQLCKYLWPPRVARKKKKKRTRLIYRKHSLCRNAPEVLEAVCSA